MLLFWRVPTPEIINITSVLITFSAIFDSHRGNVNNLGGPNPETINITSVLITFRRFLIPTGEMLIMSIMLKNNFEKSA